ncbi:preprotein translocase subunit SECE1 [Arachis stenosperma]|uniref:preprotein translocase subunit SECE1 n=1 Tax=Arachis stenosperma TaxID=217475 RepID=UPI0025ABE90E|nr:preprotein translocase subunit SECE1 [Arachis stenosperma]XP_057735825.1 preprotein translocase subunit SECE1 [Arachis stenosperma]
MALQAHSPSRLLLHSQSPLQSTQTPSTLTLSLTAAFNPKPLTLSFSRRRQRSITVSPVVEESQESSEPEAEAEAEAEEKEVTVAEELKKAMQERREKEGEEEFWGGVGREIREIEWPPFGKVLGTTSVVISVIFGSSVVLLTLNALLAELSDRVFAGKGVQDFFT